MASEPTKGPATIWQTALGECAVTRLVPGVYVWRVSVTDYYPRTWRGLVLGRKASAMKHCEGRLTFHYFRHTGPSFGFR